LAVLLGDQVVEERVDFGCTLAQVGKEAFSLVGCQLRYFLPPPSFLVERVGSSQTGEERERLSRPLGLDVSDPMRRGLLLAFALLLVASAPQALAQGGLPAACGPLEVTVAQASAAVAPGASTTLTVTVANTGNANAAVVVAASVASAGWRVSPEQADAVVNGGQSAPFEFTASAAEGAASQATVNFVAEASCQAGPLTCPTGQQFCRTSAPASAGLTLAQPEGFRIPGLTDLDVPLEYLVGGLLLLAAAVLLPLLTKRRRGGFVATCPEPLKLLRAGQGVSFPIEVTNRSKSALTVTFDVGKVPDGWSAFMAMPELQVAPGEKRSLWLMVRAPAVAATGARADVSLRVRGPGAPPTTMRVRAEIDANVGGGSHAGDAAPA
jgi:hypothetical protein